ncbi:MAG TPA: flagellar hook-basal body complex protein FliE [Acetobacteraceae bacterium]|jgi:flagellar hook-basal body complex protein FliE
MSSLIPTIVVTPSTAADAYARVDRGDVGAGGGGFGATLQRALDGAVQTGQDAENKAMQAISGEGNLTDVVTALSRAELALQTATAVRDRVVQAYQDIMKMPI